MDLKSVITCRPSRWTDVGSVRSAWHLAYPKGGWGRVKRLGGWRGSGSLSGGVVLRVDFGGEVVSGGQGQKGFQGEPKAGAGPRGAAELESAGPECGGRFQGRGAGKAGQDAAGNDALQAGEFGPSPAGAVDTPRTRRQVADVIGTGRTLRRRRQS